MKNVTWYLPGLRMLWRGRRKRTEDECKIGQKKESEHVHQDTDVRAKRQAPSGDSVTGWFISFRWLGYRVVHPTPHLEQFCFSLDRHEIWQAVYSGYRRRWVKDMRLISLTDKMALGALIGFRFVHNYTNVCLGQKQKRGTQQWKWNRRITSATTFTCTKQKSP